MSRIKTAGHSMVGWSYITTMEQGYRALARAIIRRAVVDKVIAEMDPEWRQVLIELGGKRELFSYKNKIDTSGIA